MTIRAYVFAFIALVVSPTAALAEPPDPAEWIRSIYRLYEKAQLGPKLPPRLYSPRLQKLIDADDKRTPKGDIGRLEFDVFINGQDWELSNINVTTVSRASGRAQVRADFINFKQSTEILFDLVLVGNSWRVDEVRSLKTPRWTMSKILSGAKDAFPDQQK
jgi:hypothetical protein